MLSEDKVFPEVTLDLNREAAAARLEVRLLFLFFATGDTAVICRHLLHTFKDDY